MPIKQVIVLRTDLNMRKGKIAAQAAHASEKVFFDVGRVLHTDQGPVLQIPLWPGALEWVTGLFTKVVLGCESEASLVSIHEDAKALGIPSALILDAGLTEFNGVPTLTATSLGPAEAELIDRVTGPATGRTKLL